MNISETAFIGKKSENQDYKTGLSYFPRYLVNKYLFIRNIVRDVTRMLMGGGGGEGLFIHIFMFCLTDFF